MYNSHIVDTLLDYISSDVDDDFTIYIDGLYGVAYNTNKTILKLYYVESYDDISSFTLDKDDIEEVLGSNFFNMTLKDKFDLVSSVLNSYYLSYEGTYPESYLTSKLLKHIEADIVEGDLIILDTEIGIRLNKGKTSVCIYNVIVKGSNINIKKRVLNGLDAIYLVLGCDFLLVNDSMKIEIVSDYLNSLN